MKALLIFLALLFVDNPAPKPEKSKPKFEGSWKLLKYKYNLNDELSEVPEFMSYVKNVTPTHFSWCSYNPETGSIVGTGGGTYRYDQDHYIEKTNYWLPSGSGIPGTETSFEYSFKGKQWTIKGYIKSLALDPKTGEFTKIDSTYMMEVWQRLDNFTR